MKNKLIKIFICILYTTPLYANSDNDTCNNILNLANSPSNAEAPCSIPYKKVFIELNYIDQQLRDHAGFQQNYPNAAIRIGLPSNNEFFIAPPNRINQTNIPKTGSTDSSFGFKHSIIYNQKWIFAVEDSFYTPGGSYAFGNQNWGNTFNGIVNYTINNQFSVTGMLGISRVSEAKINGGRSFNSINPDVLLSFLLNNKVSIYGEVYGQSKIGVAEGAGFNFDAGGLFLVAPNIILNLSVGQQLYNYLGGFTHYVNLGVEVLL